MKPLGAPTTAPDSIVSRIRKLAALADRAGTPEEAALAAERMQSLLGEYNLTLADIEASSPGDVAESAATAAREKHVDRRVSAMYQWQRDLMETIAENNFCIYLTRRIRKHKIAFSNRTDMFGAPLPAKVAVSEKRVAAHCLIGRSANVTASTIMYSHLVAVMRNLLPRELKGIDASGWMEGCAETLCRRLREARTGEIEKERDPGTPGLVRMADLLGSEHDLNMDFLYRQEPGTTARERRIREAEIEEERRKEEEYDRIGEELIAAGKSRHEAYYLARGEEVPPEDTRPRRFRPSRSRGYSYRGPSQREVREYARRNSDGYKRGREAGSSIGLGGALTPGESKRLK